MKYTLDQRVPSQTFWNGATALPLAITVLHSLPQMAEFELLSILCTLHGHVTAYDILTVQIQGRTRTRTLFRFLSPFKPISILPCPSRIILQPICGTLPSRNEKARRWMVKN